MDEAPADYLVHLENAKVIFDGFVALNLEVFGVPEFELRTVIGPNGAGKTTLCDVISGKTRLAEGRVFFRGQEITHVSEDEISRMGVGRKFQTPTIFDSLTLYENMALALPGRRRVRENFVFKTKAFEHDLIMQNLERAGLADVPQKDAKYLSHGQRQWLEIAMLVVQSPKLLLVDEPAAGLTDDETERTGELLLELEGSHTIIVIEHDMDFVRQLNRTVTVLNEGRVLCEGSMAKVEKDEAVIQAYLGR